MLTLTNYKLTSSCHDTHSSCVYSSIWHIELCAERTSTYPISFLIYLQCWGTTDTLTELLWFASNHAMFKVSVTSSLHLFCFLWAAKRSIATLLSQLCFNSRSKPRGAHGPEQARALLASSLKATTPSLYKQGCGGWSACTQILPGYTFSSFTSLMRSYLTPTVLLTNTTAIPIFFSSLNSLRVNK